MNRGTNGGAEKGIVSPVAAGIIMLIGTSASAALLQTGGLLGILFMTVASAALALLICMRAVVMCCVLCTISVALGSVIITLLWMFFSVYIMLSGAFFNSFIRRFRDAEKA